MLGWCTRLGQWLQKENFGLFLFRLFWGSCLIIYSFHCFRNGLLLRQLGREAVACSLPFSDVFWGVVAAFTFSWAGLFIILGFYFRLAVVALLVMHLIDVWNKLSWEFFFLPPYSLSALSIIICFAFLFIGAGSFCIKK